MKSLTVDPVRAGQARVAFRDTHGDNLSQASAARKLGVHPVTLNKIENGKANCSLELLERMSSLYGCTREWLCGEPERIDEVEAARERFAHALSAIGSGFEELTDVVAVLNRRARESGQVGT